MKCKCTLKYFCEYHFRLKHLNDNKQGLIMINSRMKK